MLLLVYAFNFIDRIMLGILVPPIKHEFLLTDTELGLLGGTAFALFYTALGIPIGWLADRLNRVWIVTIALALWSTFSRLRCGAELRPAVRRAPGRGRGRGRRRCSRVCADQRLLPAGAARTGAGGVLLWHSARQRSPAFLFGGLIAARVNWRAAFVIVGAAGLIPGAAVPSLCVREPVRGGLDEPSPAATSAVPGNAAPRLREVAQLLAGKPSFWYLSLGAASASVMGYGVYFWMPSFLVRSYHLSLPQVSVCFSALTFVSGVAGIWLGGALADRFGSTRRAAYALVPPPLRLRALGAALRGRGWSAPSSLSSLPIFVLPMALALAWLAPTASAIQHLVPPGCTSPGCSAAALHHKPDWPWRRQHMPSVRCRIISPPRPRYRIAALRDAHGLGLLPAGGGAVRAGCPAPRPRLASLNRALPGATPWLLLEYRDRHCFPAQRRVSYDKFQQTTDRVRIHPGPKPMALGAPLRRHRGHSAPAAAPAAAAAAAGPRASAVAPASPYQYGGQCVEGLSMSRHVMTNCTVTWTDKDGKVYCFSSDAAKKSFLENPTENLQKAHDFIAASSVESTEKTMQYFDSGDAATVVTNLINDTTKANNGVYPL